MGRSRVRETQAGRGRSWSGPRAQGQALPQKGRRPTAQNSSRRSTGRRPRATREWVTLGTVTSPVPTVIKGVADTGCAVSPSRGLLLLSAAW